jgi:hypothetical protein
MAAVTGAAIARSNAAAAPSAAALASRLRHTVIEHNLVGLLPRFDRKRAAGGEWGGISTVEVVVRPPEVFVRPLAHAEATALKSRAKKAKHFATRERAAILLASHVGNSVPQIAAMWMTDESHVRRVIHDFNERGMASLDPEYRGGVPAGSPTPTAARSSRWPVPVPTVKGYR